MTGETGADTTLSVLPGMAEALDLMPLGACVINVDWTVCAWNRTLVEWTGISREDALGMDLAARYPALRNNRIAGRLRQVFEAGSSAVFSAAIHKHFLAVPTRHGPPGSLMVQQTQVRLLPGQSTLALVTIGDVTSEAFQLAALRAERTQLVTAQSKLLRLMEAAETDRKRVERLHTELQEAHQALEQKNAELAELAATDALTGLANRRRFREALDAALASAIRDAEPLSLIIFDIDEFKKYNDEYGHLAGDEVLKSLAGTIGASLRVSDTVARYGGEEFVVLLPKTDSQTARQVAERLRTDIEHHAWPLRPVTSSFGVATLGPSNLGATEFLNQADRALYHAKRRGRNCVTHYEDLAGFTARLEPQGASDQNPEAYGDGLIETPPDSAVWPQGHEDRKDASPFDGTRGKERLGAGADAEPPSGCAALRAYLGIPTLRQANTA